MLPLGEEEEVTSGNEVTLRIMGVPVMHNAHEYVYPYSRL